MKSNLSINKDRRHPDILQCGEFQREILLWTPHPRDRVQTPTSWKTAFGRPGASLLVCKSREVGFASLSEMRMGLSWGQEGTCQFKINPVLTLAGEFGEDAKSKEYVDSRLLWIMCFPFLQGIAEWYENPGKCGSRLGTLGDAHPLLCHVTLAP